MGRARAELTIARAHAADVAPEDLAVAYAAVGDRGAALVWLRRSQTGFAAAEMANDPRFAGLRRAAALRPSRTRLVAIRRPFRKKKSAIGVDGGVPIVLLY